MAEACAARFGAQVQPGIPMYIRFLDGPFKGQIKDMANGAAVELLRAGRAENPYLDPAPAAPQAAEKETPSRPRRRR